MIKKNVGVSLSVMICSSKRLRTQDFHSCNTGSIPVQITRFVGVTANISDCRSEAMSSILIRTAKMLSGAMVSISVFDTDDIGSNPFSIANVGFSLTGQVPHCECGE
jgi:hypothetical protein